MKNTLHRICLAVLLVVTGWSLTVHGDQQADPNDPLARLSKKQREHFKAYSDLNDLIRKDSGFDQKKASAAVFGFLADWCQDAIKKYTVESMKAGDKAKEMTNKDRKKELEEKSALYAEFVRQCQGILKALQEGQVGGIEKAMEAYGRCEKQARAKNLQFLKREWLLYSEFKQMYFYANAMKNRQAKAEQAAQQQQMQQQQMQQRPQQNRRPVRQNAQPNQNARKPR